MFIAIENTEDLYNREAYWINQIDKECSMNLSAVVGDEIKAPISEIKRAKQSAHRKRYFSSDEVRRKTGEKTREVLKDENIRYKIGKNRRIFGPEKINEIRSLRLQGMKVIDIARQIGASEDVVGQILRGVRCAFGPGIDKVLVENCKKLVKSYKR